MKANKTERILSVAAAILFCLTLVLYFLFRIDPLWAPYNLIYSPGVLIGRSMTADLFAVASFVLTTVCALKKQPCLRTKAAKLRLVWKIVCFLFISYVLINSAD